MSGEVHDTNMYKMASNIYIQLSVNLKAFISKDSKLLIRIPHSRNY